MRNGLMVLAVVLALALPVEADVVATSRAGIQALPDADSIDWDDAGPVLSFLLNPIQVLSNGGLLVDVEKPDPSVFFRRLDQGNGWGGNFAPGDRLIWQADVGDYVALSTFGGNLLTAIGAQIQTNTPFGTFTATLETF